MRIRLACNDGDRVLPRLKTRLVHPGSSSGYHGVVGMFERKMSNEFPARATLGTLGEVSSVRPGCSAPLKLIAWRGAERDRQELCK